MIFEDCAQSGSSHFSSLSFYLQIILMYVYSTDLLSPFFALIRQRGGHQFCLQRLAKP